MINSFVFLKSYIAEWRHVQRRLIVESRSFAEVNLPDYFDWYNKRGMPTVFPQAHMPHLDRPVVRPAHPVATRAYVSHGPALRRVVSIFNRFEQFFYYIHRNFFKLQLLFRV